MGTRIVVSGLTDKRARIAGRLAALEKEAAQLRADLQNIDAVLRLYDVPDPEAIKPTRLHTRNDWFRPGEAARLALDALREAEEPLTTRAVAERMMAAKGRPPGDARALALVSRTIMESLKRMDGVVEQVKKGRGTDALWRLIR